MPEPTTNDENATDDQAVVEPVEETTDVEAPVAETEEVAAEPDSEVVETDDVDIEDYATERYQLAPSQGGPDLNEMLAELPADENGTADPADVARVLNDWKQTVLAEAGQVSQTTSLDVAREQKEQQQVMKKYPQLAKNRDDMDMVFDLRDAHALRGKNLSLTKAAAMIFERDKATRKDAADKATRTTQTVAAAHLESSSVTADSEVTSKAKLYEQATQGSGQEAAEARNQLLADGINKMFKSGELR